MSPQQKIRVLLVDDDPDVHEALKFEFGGKYALTTADCIDAVKKLTQTDNKFFDVAIIDMQFGKEAEGGLKLINWLKKYDPLLECIVLTGHPEIDNVVDCLKADAYNYVVKGQSDTIGKLTDSIELAVKEPKSIQFRTSLRLLKIQRTFFDKIFNRDPFFFGHGERVSHWSRVIAEKEKLMKKDKDYLEFAALFHDMGKEKQKFPFKPGKLTRDEEKRWREYPQYGQKMLQDIFAPDGLHPKAILDAVLYHRRNWDGSGFPVLEPGRENEMVGEKIPLFARIIAVSCEFDRGFTRPGQRFLRDPKEAKDHIIKFKGTRLDPRLVEVFLEAYDEGLITRNFPFRWREEEFGRIRDLVQNQMFEEAGIAGKEWSRGIEEAPEFDCVRAAACVGLGDLLAPIRSQREQALRYYTDAVRWHPAYAEAFYKRGLCYLKQNCWQEAERDFDMATAIIPTYLEAHLERAGIFLKDNQYMKAQRLYDLVLALDREVNVKAFLGKARVFLHQKYISEALACFRNAEENIVKFLAQTDLSLEERKEYEVLRVQALLDEAKAFLSQKEIPKALACLTEAKDKIDNKLELKGLSEDEKYKSLRKERGLIEREAERMQNPQKEKPAKGKKTGREGAGQ